ncbi:MAG TPA: RDD family protein [bacterium]|nr:RDD family protein [bacterium]
MTQPAGTMGGAAVGGGMQLAEPTERLIAAVIDWAILIGINIVLGIVGGILSKITGLLGVLVWLIQIIVPICYFVYLWAMDNPITARGQSIGKKMRNIKIVKEDGSDITVGDAVLRVIGYYISGIVILLGYVWILIDKEKHQGWHDKIAKTLVVKV